MRLAELEQAVLAHKGSFLCKRVNDDKETRIIHFCHEVQPPVGGAEVPSLPGFQDFYDTFGSITFYLDRESGDAAAYVADPSEWAALHTDFSSWVDDLDEDERMELLPDWIEDILVIGEEPHTGNYLLTPATGREAGVVFLFDHDGFEFTEQAATLVEYVEKLLDPGDHELTMMASHMRFAGGDRSVQWSICELEDNRGNVARTGE